MSQNTRKKLAIVIPYYKIDFFEETIKSVAAQSNRDFALYIGNDKSQNDPLPIIGKYLQEEDYHYFNYTDNLGGENPALQWERILNEINEEWFQVLGDDDIIADNFVQEFYNSLPFLEEKQINSIKFVHEWIDENNETLEVCDYHTDILDSIDFVVRKYRGEIKSSLSENIFKTKMYRQYGFEKIPLAWGCDEIAILTFADYKKIFYNRNTKVGVRISAQSISGNEELDGKKEYAKNIFREKLLIRHSAHFPKVFVKHLIREYLAYCKEFKTKANNQVVFSTFTKMGIFRSMKFLFTIFSINKA
ncbi:glycosyltransferase family 2 protein [Chryseobacterium aahli]|uniref:glycosyltransferase family A protein n=1 Tax=Chryseobacterium aahli TaxID=1278643 RepID=UPI001F613DFB|nr:glycosyltransferase family A protein [Chryseobacterium aahli]MCI3937995.1 glycosyltransferase family 2 protein [Chryseobacterium aahli]